MRGIYPDRFCNRYKSVSSNLKHAELLKQRTFLVICRWLTMRFARQNYSTIIFAEELTKYLMEAPSPN